MMCVWNDLAFHDPYPYYNHDQTNLSKQKGNIWEIQRIISPKDYCRWSIYLIHGVVYRLISSPLLLS